MLRLYFSCSDTAFMFMVASTMPNAMPITIHARIRRGSVFANPMTSSAAKFAMIAIRSTLSLCMRCTMLPVIRVAAPAMSGRASVMIASVESLKSKRALIVGRRAKSEPKPSPCAKNTMKSAMRARRIPSVMAADAACETVFIEFSP